MRSAVVLGRCGGNMNRADSGRSRDGDRQQPEAAAIAKTTTRRCRCRALVQTVSLRRLAGRSTRALAARLEYWCHNAVVVVVVVVDYNDRAPCANRATPGAVADRPKTLGAADEVGVVVVVVDVQRERARTPRWRRRRRVVTPCRECQPLPLVGQCHL